MYLPLWLIFCWLHLDFIIVRTAYTSEIWEQLTKKLLTKSGTERFRENIRQKERENFPCHQKTRMRIR